jgi:regulator of protease activity HflC (stomatin/prohibitin superfamily)
MIADRINAAAAIAMLVIGGGVAIVGQPPVQAMLAALIVVVGAWQAWCVRRLGDDARALSSGLLFLIGAALGLSGW